MIPPSRNTVGNTARERGVACSLERDSVCGFEHGLGNTAVHVARNVVGNVVHMAENVTVAGNMTVHVAGNIVVHVAGNGSKGGST